MSVEENYHPKDSVPKLFVNGKRLSGREIEGLRGITIEVGVLDSAQGSCKITWGRNMIIAAVRGPKEVFPKHLTDYNRAIVNTRYAMAPFSGQEEHSRAGPNRRAIEISKVARHVFQNVIVTEQFPKTQIDVIMEILQSDGGTRVAGITAAALALVDAGIPVKDIVQGVSIGKIEGKLVTDLDKDEDNYGSGDVPFIVSLRTGEVLLFQLDGMFTIAEFEQMIDMAFRGAAKVKEIQVKALLKKYQPVENTSVE